MIAVRVAGRGDMSAVDALLARAYPRLLKADYPGSVLVTALPLISRANPSLVTSGSYFLAENDEGLLGAGGVTRARPPGAAAGRNWAHVRHVVTDDRALRRGVGRAIMSAVVARALDWRAAGLEAMSTRTAVPFYAALGFDLVAEIDVPLRPGITIPAVRMRRRL